MRITDVIMGKKKAKARDPLPEHFASYEEAGAFWDTHDSTDYLDQMQPVIVEAKLKRRRYEFEIDEDVAIALGQQAASRHLSASKLASNLLRHIIAGQSQPQRQS